MTTLADGSRASLWTVSGGGIGLVSGFLGVDGGFVRMPAIYDVIGTSLRPRSGRASSACSCAGRPARSPTAVRA